MNILRLPLRIIRKIRYLGALNCVKCFSDFIVFSYYTYTFNIDRWHKQGGLHCSKRNPYIVEIVNSISPESVVDIGCGLGAILSEVNASSLLGIDYSEKVISAAKKITRNNNIDFKHGTFDHISGNYEGLIATNFLHSFDQSIVKNWIESAISRNSVKFLIFDEIHENSEGYKYKHKFDAIVPKIKLIKRKEFILEKRDIVLFQVIS